MPRSGVVNVPNRLSATAIDQRSSAQYGQNSAPMYSISGLPLLVSAGPEIAFTGFGLYDRTEPLRTELSALAGTLVTCRATLAGSTVPVGELALGVFRPVLSTTKTTTTTTTSTMMPPVRSIRLRTCRCRAAARCSAIRARALCRPVRPALLIPARYRGGTDRKQQGRVKRRQKADKQGSAGRVHTIVA